MSSKFIQIAQMEMGVKEIKGPDANPRVMEYLNSTTIRATDDVTPWCSGFVNWVVIQAGMAGTDSAASASWRKWGQVITKPEYGCIMGYTRPDGSGHVGFYVGEDESTYSVLGGNQADMVKVSRFSKEKGDRKWWFRKPKTKFNSKTNQAGAGIVAVTALEYAPVGADGISNVLAEIKGARAEIGEIKDEVSSWKQMSQGPSAFEMASPYIILALAGFILYERFKKIKGLGV
jgi:uncharacterized protein (TIGR02594 family)